MKFHIYFVLAVFFLLGGFSTARAQVDSVIGQVTNSSVESFAGGISGDGRLIVFESAGDLATENPRNADGNREIFLFDYAQRRIFQITDTKSLRTDTTLGFIQSNTKVSIVNLRPVISNDGRWIAFSSNATTATPTVPNSTNPGSFNAESFTDAMGNNPLTADGNTEMWLYQVPATSPADLSFGGEIPATDLSAGTFTRVTNTLPSRLPVAGSATTPPVVGEDNRDASISDNGNYIAFVSNRDLVVGGNASPNGNDEIFTFARTLGAVKQITQTTRGTLAEPISNLTPTISGNGLRVAFQSNADNPIIGMTGGSNSDKNFEIFYADMDATGAPTGTRKQVTTTARVNAGDIVNILDLGRRMSRDGRYIAFDSYADLAGENSGTNYSSFALYLYDTTLTTNAFRRIGPRSDADTAASGGDVPHYAGFTDTDANGTPATLVLETRENIIADGTIAATNDAGLNTNADRPAQIYSYPLNVPAASATFTRLTKFPTPNTFIASTQPLPSNSLRRMTFNLALTEFGTGNSDSSSEAFYFLLPVVTAQTPAVFSFSTGASRIPVSASPVPTPSPTATPTPSPSPSPSPTPITPPAVQGVSPGELTILDYSGGISQQVVAQTAVGSVQRRFTLPIELSGVTVTVNGAAAGLKSVSQRKIVFVVPPGLAAVAAGTVYPVVINNNGVVFRGSVTVVPARPDIFTFLPVPAPNGRARIFNATNPVLRTEPFVIRTRKIKGGVFVATVLRLYLTGVNNIPAASINVQFGTGQTGIMVVPTAAPVLREPGVYSIDFPIPATLQGAGDLPIIVTVTVNGITYQSRLDDTAPRFRIL
ncbi:MAG: hypothetical protein ACR2HG_00590 [Pyrinomonadaceae bacterium]